MSRGFWDGRRVLVTGHTGFKGAWLALWLQQLGAHVTGLSLPPEDRQGVFSALSPWPELDSHLADIRDRSAVEAIFAGGDPQTVFHLAGQSLVRRGYSDPLGTFEVNLLGTAHVLQACGRSPSLSEVVVVTSDKVYANVGDGRPFVESDPLGGADPYSSSKACAEMAVSSWREPLLRQGALVATARAGNVIGGGDRAEDRLLPDLWRALEERRPLPLRYPAAIRAWQFVLEPLHGYLLLAEHLSAGREHPLTAVNFGPTPNSCRSVVEVVERVVAIAGRGEWEALAGTPLPEAGVLRVDPTLASERLGWRPVLALDVALEWTVEWWRAAEAGEDMRKVATSQIEAYARLLQA